MIDAHCHMEQEDFKNDLEDVVKVCNKENVRAVISSCTEPKDFSRTIEIAKKFKDYIFACASLHPQFVKDINGRKLDEYFESIRENRKNLVAIGESGLDYFWIKEESWRRKQKELFIQHIELAKELKLPLVVHTREAWEDCLIILEQEDVKNAVLHLWGSKEPEHVKSIVDNNYFITVGPLISMNKTRKKLVRDLPLENLMLETDSPWFGQNGERGLPTNVKIPCQEIAEIKKIEFDKVNDITDNNAIKFFSLNL